MKSIIVFIAVMFLLSAFSFSTVAYADDDTYVKIQEMVNDLGGPQYRAQNNGKVQQCADRGTKQITIKKSRGGTSYKGIYKNCSEYGTTRDGHVEIATGG